MHNVLRDNDSQSCNNSRAKSHTTLPQEELKHKYNTEKYKVEQKPRPEDVLQHMNKNRYQETIFYKEST